ASCDGKEVHCHKSMGHVAEIFTASVLNSLPGNMAIGHTRYSTAGDTAILNAQPFSVACNKGRIAVAHNGNLTNAAELRKELEDNGSIFQATSDTEVILHLVARSSQKTLASALREALLVIEGAFSLVFLSQDRIIVARDPHGFRPLAIGRMNLRTGPAYVFASETCAFDLIDAHYVGDVEPGEMVIAGPDGLQREFYTVPQKRAQCVFEHVYFSRPDSTVFGRSVQQSREMMGRLLSQELPVEADVVVPIPDSGVAAALGYAHASKIPFRHGLIRNHYVGRTFIEPSQAIRDFGVRLKLNPVREILKGKSVVLVDDSLVRGTTSQKIVRMVRNAGAREVHVRISCPPTMSPCFYGVDTPTKRELIAANQSIDEIREFIGCDTLAYLSLENLGQAVADEGDQYCYACYTGRYPTELVNIEELMTSRPDR
ncbi:MAG: amidophosphoribosyltransferase, partial [Candidatus Solibacter usitatus]|nr:amidophosphoribosyltransferase [Candidatus Solibacter usitatus]